MRNRVERVALAVAGYHAEHGEYPQSLDDLVPEWLDEIPSDSFHPDREQIRYRLERDRVAVYSVWGNEEDDRGVDGEHRNEGDLVLTWKR